MGHKIMQRRQHQPLHAAMQPTGLKRARCPNFTSDEKRLYFSILHKHRHVLDNKNLDGPTCKQKQRTWELITAEFNERTKAGIYRLKDSLKMFYLNSKKRHRLRMERRHGLVDLHSPPNGHYVTAELGGAASPMHGNDASSFDDHIFGYEQFSSYHEVTEDGLQYKPAQLDNINIKRSPLSTTGEFEDDEVQEHHQHDQQAQPLYEIDNEELELDPTNHSYASHHPMSSGGGVVSDESDNPSQQQNSATGPLTQVSESHQPSPTDNWNRILTERMEQQLVGLKLEKVRMQVRKLNHEYEYNVWRWEREREDLETRRKRDEREFQLRQKNLLLDMEMKQAQLRQFIESDFSPH